MQTRCWKLSIIYVSITRLKNNPRNSRTHSKHQCKLIAKSIKEFGFVTAILIDKDFNIIAGHARVDAAKSLGMTEVPTIRIDHLTPDQLKAYVIADNRLAELGGWDKSILSIELQQLLIADSDFDITITGFEIPEIDALLSDPEKEPDPDDSIEVEVTQQAVSQPGSLWKLGKNTVFCGNATQQSSYARLLGKKRAALVFIDPPYNVRINGNAANIGKKGSVQYEEFQMAAGEMSEFEFTSFLNASLKLLAKYSLTDSVHFVCMDWRHMGELISAGKQAYPSLLNLCVWAKNTGGMGSFYRSQHELIFVFKNGKGQYRNNIQLGRYGRNRTNVWEYPSVNTLSRSGEEGNLLAMHPTVKPVALVADALLDCSARGDLVLDAFLGSGSTLIAAERTGRVCYGMELDPLYVDTAIRRWQRYTGDFAVDSNSGERFDDLANKTSNKPEVQHV